MKRMLRNVVLVASAIAAGAASADWCSDFCPTVGVDYKWAHIRARGGFEGLFPRTFTGASVYLGTRFCENIGVELGYDWLGRKSRTLFVPTGTTFVTPVGAIATLSTPATLTSTVRLSQWRLDLNGYLPMGCDGFDLIGSLGIGAARARVSLTPALGTPTFLASSFVSESRTRAVWRLGVGAQYMLTCNVGLRGMYRWEGLSGVRYRSPITASSVRVFRNSSAFTLGLFVNF